MPSPAGKGDREAVDEESRTQKPSGCEFSWIDKEKTDTKTAFCNPLSSSVTPFGRATFPAGEG